MQIKFMMSEETVKALSWEEYEVLEMAMEGQLKLYRVRPVMARFLVDEQDQPVSQEDGMKILGKVSLGDMPMVVQAFVDGLKNSTVPKANGTSSEQPSEASAAD